MPPEAWADDDPEDWVQRRYRVTFHLPLGETFRYGIQTRCGEHKAVAIALRNHLLGQHGFFEDFPLAVEVKLVDREFTAAELVEMEASDLGDLNEG